MRKSSICIRTVIVALVIGAHPVWPGPNQNAKIVVHLRSTTLEAPCTGYSTHPSCQYVRTAGPLYPTMMYGLILVMDANAAAGVSSVSCGIDYDGTQQAGLDIGSWTLCAQDEFQTAGVNGPWPAPLSTNRIVWGSTTTCQRFEPGGAGTGVVAAAGYFYCSAYTPDDLKIITAPGTGMALVESCTAVVDTVEGGGVVRSPSHLGYARFSSSGTEPGYNPCGLDTPVQGVSWSHIKNLYQ